MADPWQPIQVATMLVVADIDRSAGFYRDLLGFDLREHQSGLILLGLGPTLLYLVSPGGPTPDRPGISLARTNGPDLGEPGVPGNRLPGRP
jgi:catechol 2,3-dioxygenase-like lactoylglutathione lyase family enzyme